MATAFSVAKKKKRGTLKSPRGVDEGFFGSPEDSRTEAPGSEGDSGGSPRRAWSDGRDDASESGDKVGESDRPDVVALANGWIDDIEGLHETITGLSDVEREALRRQTTHVRRAVRMLGQKAAMVDEVVGCLDRAEERLAAAEAEVTELRSRLRIANEEISRLRTTERPVTEVSKEGLEVVSNRLIRTMEDFERRVAEHARRYAELQSSFSRRVHPARTGVNPDGSSPEDMTEVETVVSKDGRAAAVPWSAVVGRRARSGSGPRVGSLRLQSTLTPGGPDRRREAFVRGVGRAPRSSVVLIRPLDGGAPGTEMLRKIRDRISLRDYGISNIRFREAVKGGVLLEVLDRNVTLDKVDLLAEAIGTTLAGNASVSRPVRKAEFRLRGFDPSIPTEELRETVARAGGCPVSTVSVSDFRRVNGGHWATWVCCPVIVARSLLAGKCLKVGWSVATIDRVHLKRLQCYRCWEYGHVRGACGAAVDRSGHCFRCGEAGHMAGGCTNKLSCVLCKDGGSDYDHRLGSETCKSVGLPPVRGKR